MGMRCYLIPGARIAGHPSDLIARRSCIVA